MTGAQASRLLLNEGNCKRDACAPVNFQNTPFSFGRILRHFHPDIPEFDYLVSFESEDVHDGDWQRVRRVLHARVDSDQIAFRDGALDVKLRVWKCFAALGHARLK